MDTNAPGQRDKAIITGIYLSKFNAQALREFGFSSYRQAYNILGYALHTKPSSIKLYRDEFDSIFPNGRHGWNREPREYCRDILAKVGNMTFHELSDMIRAFTAKTPEAVIPHSETSRKAFSADRLITGESAEEYFRMIYGTIEPFRGYTIHDTTRLGCGFDFKLTHGHDFYCIEVKGLNSMNGSIMVTAREYDTAMETGEKYCLFVVRNFREKPEHVMFFNPLRNSNLSFRKQKREITEITYTSNI